MSKLTATRMTDATIGNQIDNKVGELEADLAAILGIPLETDIAIPGFGFTANGLDFVYFGEAGGDPAPAAIRRGVDGFVRYNNGQYIGKVAPLPPHVVMPFYQDTAPIGWVRIVDAAYNDRMVRIVTGARANPGTWVISGLADLAHTHGLAGHFHSISHQHDLSAHVHGMSSHVHATPSDGFANTGSTQNYASSGANTGGPNTPNTEVPSADITGASTAGNSGGPSAPSDPAFVTILSDGSWRPPSLDFILAELV